MATTELRQDEAVPLAHALVARLAEQVGARILFIKGPTAVALGARPARPSSDVDVLVAPADFAAMVIALRAAGWGSRSEGPTFSHATDVTFDHSEHLTTATWPCDIDVHYSFPGFLSEPEVVFDALWERRASVPVAGVPVPAPDRLGQALVVALHALRDPGRAASVADLGQVRRVVRELPEEERAALVALARATGSLQTAAPVLPSAASEAGAVPEGLAAWEFRQAYGEVPVTMWLMELRAAPWRGRPHVLRRALFPTVAELERHGFQRSQGLPGVARLWVRRWRRALRALPSAARAVSRASTLRHGGR